MKIFDFAKKFVAQRGRISRVALLCLAVLFVTAQSISLVHAHEYDLTRHLDCELCLHVGGLDQALVDTSAAEPVLFEQATYSPFVVAPCCSSVASPNSRAPPLFN